MDILTRPILEINTSNLLKNYNLLQELAHNAIASAVVKDDAYGIGATEVVKLLYQKAGCKYFFVAHAIEGERIRPFAPDAKIFVLQGIGSDCIESYKKANLIPVICSLEQLDFWKKNKINGITPAIQIESGLNRLGFRRADIEKLSSQDKKSFSMVISHLACADEKEHFMNEAQLKEFDALHQEFFASIPASLCASDGTFLGKDFQKNVVRLGAALYGINTAPYRENQMLPVIRLKAPVLNIAELKKGEFVGYSASYRAHCDKKIAVISIGYGDGVPRSLSNIGKVFFNINGKAHEARIIGRISMDNIICDVTNIKDLQISDMAEVINDFYTLDDIARDAKTIGYEILSRIGKNTRCLRIVK